MSHIAYRERGQDVTLEFDVVVVGSGAGGATAAVSLARHGLKVCIVEAGAWRDPEHYPSSSYGGLRDLMPEFGAQVAVGRAFWPIVRAEVVGGTTVVNSAICVRTPMDVFELWRDEHGITDAKLPEQIWGYQDRLESELHVSVTPTEAMGRSNDHAVLAAKRMGFDSHRTDRFVKDCVGSGQCLQGCKGERKQSMNLNYVPEVVSLGGHVVSCAPVHKVLIEQGKAVGVTGTFMHPLTKKKGAQFTIRAKQGVFVAGSAVASPVVLINSGIRHPALGQFFRAHPGAGVFGCYDHPIDHNIGATQGWASMAYRHEGFKLETLSLQLGMVASRISGGGRRLMEKLQGYREMCMWVAAVRSETVGSVTTGMFGPVVYYSMQPKDMKRLRASFHRLAQMHVAAGASAVIPGIAKFPAIVPADKVDTILEAPIDPRCYVGILSHLFGGCTFGADENKSLCDIQGRVRGVENLIISDASGIPSTLGVNPQHTIMALSMLRVDQFVGAL